MIPILKLYGFEKHQNKRGKSQGTNGSRKKRREFWRYYSQTYCLLQEKQKMNNHRHFIWLIILYNCRYKKKNSGVLSDFEEVLGYYYQNKAVRDFLKILIKENCLEFKEIRIVNNICFEAYVINKKNLFNMIKEFKEYFNNLLDFMHDRYLLIGDEKAK